MVEERVQSEYGAPRTDNILPLNKIFPRIKYDKPKIPPYFR